MNQSHMVRMRDMHGTLLRPFLKCKCHFFEGEKRRFSNDTSIGFNWKAIEVKF